MNSNDFYRLLSTARSVKMPQEDGKIYWYKSNGLLITSEYAECIDKVMAYTNEEHTQTEDVSNEIDDDFSYALDVTDFDWDSGKNHYYLVNSTKIYVDKNSAATFYLDGKEYKLLNTGSVPIDTLYSEQNDIVTEELNLKNYVKIDDVDLSSFLGTNSYSSPIKQDEVVTGTRVALFKSEDVIYDDGNYYIPVDTDEVTSVTVNGVQKSFELERQFFYLYPIDDAKFQEIASGEVTLMKQYAGEEKNICSDDLITIDGQIYIMSGTSLSGYHFESELFELEDHYFIASLDYISDYENSDFIVNYVEMQTNQSKELMLDKNNFITIDKETYLFIHPAGESETHINSIQYGKITEKEVEQVFSEKQIKTIMQIDVGGDVPYDYGYIEEEAIHPLDLYPTDKWNFYIWNGGGTHWENTTNENDTYSENKDNIERKLKERKYSCDGQTVWFKEKENESHNCIHIGVIKRFYHYNSEYTSTQYFNDYKISYSYDGENDVYVQSKIEKIQREKTVTGSTGSGIGRKITPILAIYVVNAWNTKNDYYCNGFIYGVNLTEFEREKMILVNSHYWLQIDSKKVSTIYYRDYCYMQNPLPFSLLDGSSSGCKMTQYAWGLYQEYCTGLRKNPKMRSKYVLMSRCFPDGKWDMCDSVFYKTEDYGECKEFRCYNTKTDKYGNVRTTEGGGIVSIASPYFMCTKDIPAPGPTEFEEECDEDDGCECYLAVYKIYQSCSCGKTSSVSYSEKYKYIAEDVTIQMIKTKTFAKNWFLRLPKQKISKVKEKCYRVKGREYKKEYVTLISSKQGAKTAWQIFYDNFSPLSFGDNTCSSSPCKCEDGEVLTQIPIGVTNKDNPTLDLPANIGKQFAGSTVSLYEMSGGVTYGSGTIDDEGNVVGISSPFKSQYSYNGYMYYLVVKCKDGNYMY